MSSLNLVEDNSSNRLYLNCDVSGREDIVGFEVNMLDNNAQIPGLVSMFRIVQNNQTIFRYDVTGLIPINRYFGVRFSKSQLWNLVKGFCLVDETIEEYMLRSEGLCISFGRIYVDPSTGEIKMIYLPVKESINDENISMVQCTNIVLNSIVADLSEDAVYYEEWKLIAGDRNLDSLQTLKKKIEALEERKENRVKVMQEKAEEERKKAREEAEERERAARLQQEMLEQQNQGNRKGKMGLFGSKDKGAKSLKNRNSNCSEPIVQGMAIPGGGSVTMPNGGTMAIPGGGSVTVPNGGNRTEKAQKEKHKKEKPTKEKPVKENKGLFGKKAKNDTGELVNLQTDSALYQKNQAINNRQFVSEEGLHTVLDTSRRASMPNPAESAVNNESIQNITPDTVPTPKPIHSQIPKSVQQMETQRKRAWLINSSGIMTEVSKLPFVVGRQGGVADIIIENNPEIGRQHIIVTYSEGSYFITDNRSMNHTYLNRQELPSGVPYPLNSGDVIVLGQEGASVAFRFQSE